MAFIGTSTAGIEHKSQSVCCFEWVSNVYLIGEVIGYFMPAMCLA